MQRCERDFFPWNGRLRVNAKDFLSGLRWTSAATVINFIAQFFFLGVMARLLDPAVFGLMAMSAIVLRFASFFAQMGAGQALIQKAELGPRDIGAALTLTLAVSVVLYAAMWLLAPLAGIYFKSEALVELVRWLGINLIVSSLAGIALAYLRREGRFAALSAVEVASYVIGYGAVGVVCAYQGLGVWSLVIASISQAGMACLLGFAVARMSWHLTEVRGAMGHFWDFGSKHSLTGFIEFIGANLESLYLGRFAGQHELGLYSRGQLITNLPVEQTVGAFGKVIFPLLSKLQNDRPRLGEVFLGLLLGIGLLSAPISFGVSAAAEDIVAVLLGPKWSDAIPVVQWLAFAVTPMFLYFACGITLDSIAALKPKLRIQSFTVVAKLALILALASQGLVGVILAVVAAEYIRLALGLHLCRRELGLSPARIVGAVGFSLLAGVLVYTAVRLGYAALSVLDIVLWLRFVVEMLTGLLVMAVIVFSALHLLPRNSPWRSSAVLSRPLAYMSRLACVRGS